MLIIIFSSYFFFQHRLCGSNGFHRAYVLFMEVIFLKEIIVAGTLAAAVALCSCSSSDEPVAAIKSVQPSWELDTVDSDLNVIHCHYSYETCEVKYTFPDEVLHNEAFYMFYTSLMAKQRDEFVGSAVYDKTGLIAAFGDEWVRSLDLYVLNNLYGDSGVNWTVPEWRLYSDGMLYVSLLSDTGVVAEIRSDVYGSGDTTYEIKDDSSSLVVKWIELRYIE